MGELEGAVHFKIGAYGASPTEMSVTRSYRAQVNRLLCCAVYDALIQSTSKETCCVLCASCWTHSFRIAALLGASSRVRAHEIFDDCYFSVKYERIKFLVIAMFQSSTSALSFS